jgi:large subunit ribosomal protein L23
MNNPQDIIIRPIITEKSNDELALGKYTFQVAKTATKTQIKQAVEQLFQVKVLDVNTMQVLGKNKRVGVHLGKKPDWKKAIVRIDTNPKADTFLEKGKKEKVNNKKYKDSIEEFSGVQA